MSSTTKNVAPQSFDRTVADLKQGVASATAKQAEVTEKAVQAAKEIADFNKSTIEAITQFGQIMTAGSQDLFREMAASSQAAFAEAMAGFQAMVAAKTVKERFELQASLARASATRAVTEAGRFAQAGIALAEKAAAPLTERATVAAEKFASLKA